MLPPIRHILALVGFALLSIFTARNAASAERRNVLFIAVDDLNDWIGCLGGHPQARTPNIDRLARSGLLFTNAHCAAPLCNPSRAAVMTGFTPATSGVHGNQQDWRKSPYLKGKPTLPEYFRKHGYWTGACGKVFHANHGGECGALNGGHGGLRGLNHPASWTERHPSKDRQLSKPAVMPGQNFNGLDIWHWDWGPIDVADDKTTDGKSVDWAIKKLKEKRDRPFFLAVGIYKPHGPWYVPRQYFDRFPVKSIKLPVVKKDDVADIPPIALRYLRNPNHFDKLIREHHLYPSAVQAYLANIHFADAMIGRVLDALEKSPHAKNTIICLWSDHGWHLGEKQRWHKSTCWEEATRVPLMIVAPNVTSPGSKTPRPVSLIDLYPTLVELCGLPQRDDLDGHSLVPLLKDPQAERKQPAVTALAGRHHSVRTERWRYTRYSDGSEELYDHKSDPYEWTNLAKRPEHTQLKRKLAKWLPKTVRRVPEPPAKERGFRPLFNGYDLTGWKADPNVWSVKDGRLIAKLAGDSKGKQTLQWIGGRTIHYELRFEVRSSGSARITIGSHSKRWKPETHQVVVKTGGEGDRKAWAEVTLSVRGRKAIQTVNGKAMSIDISSGRRSRTGRLFLTVQGKPGTTIAFRNIRYKELSPPR